MRLYKTALRILPLVVVLWAATLGWSQNVAKGSFTLPVEARWGQIALVPGDYTFRIPENLSSPSPLELRHDGKFMGYILADTSDFGAKFNQSSMLLVKSGDTYAVRELRIGDVAAFTYKLPKTRASQLARIAPTTTSVPVRTSAKQ